MTVFYKNLNSIRFIAASLVIVHHIEQLKFLNGLDNFSGKSIIFLFGKLGVNIFFVLSGFLITSLLLIEKEKFQKVDIGKFYMRRVLRIWPLYFLIVLTSVFVIPEITSLNIPQWSSALKNTLPSLLLMIFFLPNVQISIFGQIPYAAQTWSIGVEEQFYLIWPLIVNKAKNAFELKKIIALSFCIYIVVRILLKIISGLSPQLKILSDISMFMSNRFQIECMLIGGFFSVINVDDSLRRFLTARVTQLTSYSIVFIFLIAGLKFKTFFWDIYGIFFGIIILNLVNTETSIFNLENYWLNYLGKISYGMYMLHTIIINCVIRFVTHNSVLIYLLSFAFTILLSILSYNYFEKSFLKIKERFSKSTSTDSKQEEDTLPELLIYENRA